jgi:hypothetical protein
MDDPQFIVAEISVSWPGTKEIISKQLEKMIDFNASRGYSFHSFSYGQSFMNDECNETIIAVFKKARH